MAGQDKGTAGIVAMVDHTLAERRDGKEATLRTSFGSEQHRRNARHFVRTLLREALSDFQRERPRATYHEQLLALRDFIDAQPTRRRKHMERDLLAFALDKAVEMLAAEQREAAHEAMSKAALTGEGRDEALALWLKSPIALPRD